MAVPDAFGGGVRLLLAAVGLCRLVRVCAWNGAYVEGMGRGMERCSGMCVCFSGFFMRSGVWERVPSLALVHAYGGVQQTDWYLWMDGDEGAGRWAPFCRVCFALYLGCSG